MYLDRITQTFAGYVRFEAEGYYIERFINHCRNNEFNLDELNRVSDTVIKASVLTRNYKEVCKIAKKNRCKIKIYEKKGIPFIVNKYRKRKIFVFALFFLFISVFILSRFVWNIEIQGTKSIPQEEIMNILNEEGLAIGKYKNSIDERKIIDSIRSRRADISWVRNKN